MPDDDDRTAITCTFDWEPTPHLTFHFSPGIAPENIREIALVMAKTAAAKMDCMNLCALEGDYNAQPGNA